MQTTSNILDKNWKALIKPNKLDITSNEDKTLAKVTAEPLEKGFGQTIGNSLRRILLSSIQGAAVTAIQIDGVLHEFSSIKGVREDVTDIVLIVKNLSTNFFTNTILLTAAFFLFFITVRDFFKKKFSNLSQNISHFGFSLLILSILFNNIFSSEIITNLKIGETFVSDKFKISFKDINQKDEQNYKAIIGKFEVIDSKGSNLNMSPELRIYNQPNIVTSEADIKTNLLTDKFMTMNLVQNQDYFNIRYQIKPFMAWIWISVILICFGGLISLFKKRYEN